MENTTQQPYHDSPTPSRSPSPMPSSTTTTIKPLPALPHEAPLPVLQSDILPTEPYRDDPPTPPSSTRQQQQLHTHIPQQPFQPYTDSPPLTPDDDNIPLAHFILNPYPQEAPPSYSVAVRQSHTYHDTLIQYVPEEHTFAQYLAHHDRAVRPVLIEIDEESGEVISRTDDVRHSIEKVVAMFVVAGLLLLLSAVLAWLALGTGVIG
ncbi:hypothetical protein GQ44DRAFT_702549 [Phaeosphaeriaceae sp. PMI808]|nr:hypothetical protein GQ44DRAFT_702549 [Phaeosphaeriaceae sp. PMI808]